MLSGWLSVSQPHLSGYQVECAVLRVEYELRALSLVLARAVPP